MITSKDNEIIKEIKKLKEKKFRKDKFVVEGIKMVKEAINEKASIDKIVFCNLELEKEIENLNQFNYIEVSEKVFKELTDVVTPQGVLAVIKKDNKANFDANDNYKGQGNKKELDLADKCAYNGHDIKTIFNITNKENFINENNKIEVHNSKDIEENSIGKIDMSANFILALDNLQDPGNLGTIIRTADAANLKQIIVSKDTVDAYSPKVIRSTMGAIFRVQIVEVDNLKETLQNLQKSNFKIVTTLLQTENSIYDINYQKKVVVIGNEANGVEKEIQEMSDYKVKIPMLGKTESLNASVAASIMIYEYVRQSLL